MPRQRKSVRTTCSVSFGSTSCSVDIDIRIGQVDGEDGVVVADVGAQQQRLLAVEQQFQTRQIARVAIEDAVRSAGRRADVAMAVEHDEAVAVLEGAARPRGGSGRWNVERGFRSLLDERRGRVLPRQWWPQAASRPCRSGKVSARCLALARAALPTASSER